VIPAGDCCPTLALTIKASTLLLCTGLYCMWTTKSLQICVCACVGTPFKNENHQWIFDPDRGVSVLQYNTMEYCTSTHVNTETSIHNVSLPKLQSMNLTQSKQCEQGTIVEAQGGSSVRCLFLSSLLLVPSGGIFDGLLLSFFFCLTLRFDGRSDYIFSLGRRSSCS
jgi:hypothetical protein